MKIAIMQPYFLPYVGYFQLMNAVDEFVVYDDVQFSKRGWIQRNRILLNGADHMISLPLRKDSDYLNICDRKLALSFGEERRRLLRRVEAAYSKAPYFSLSMPIVVSCLECDESNLFWFIWHSLQNIRDHLGITTKLVISSSIEVDKDPRGADRVVAICKSRSANHYINPIGGKALYGREEFDAHGLRLSFLQTNRISYPQFGNEFVPNLSIIDVMMFNSVEQIRMMLNDYSLLG